MTDTTRFIDSNNQFLIEQMQGYNLTKALVNQELTGIFNTETLRDMQHIMRMYRIYLEGTEFDVDRSSQDVNPTQWHAKEIKSLIDKEARFLFSIPPDITLKDLKTEASDNSRVAPNQALLKKVLKVNRFNSKLVRACKDCLIGKRIAIVTNFNPETGIDISFVPSLEFVYETDPADVDIMTKFIQFYNVVVNEDKAQQRIYKKKWYLENGVCRVIEELYDGNANLIETITPDMPTKFNYIPVAVVINDGLSGDPFGVSDCEANEATEQVYSKLASKDIDSLRKGTDQITYILDADPRTTKGLSRAPGALWDIVTDPTQEGKTAIIGTLDNPMSYSPALDLTLHRLSADMHSQLSVPDTSSEALQGIITSGKTMQAIYWDLMVRCDEKLLDWIPAFERMVESILDGCKLYPEIARLYTNEQLVDDYEIEISNSYPILQDETEEKASDMMEVNSKVRSKKSYMKKWLGLTDADVDNELKQIQFEMSLFEQENYAPDTVTTDSTDPADSTDFNGGEE